MEIKEMQMSDIEQRSLEIEEEVKDENADLDALAEEVMQLEERKAQIEAEVEQRKKEAEEVLKSAKVIEPIEERKMENIEVRNTKEYIDAYAEFMKSGKDAECRALLTENASGGTVPVPEFVYDVVKTAWERDGIMALVRKSYLKGNLKIGFEISGDGAVMHTEGGAAIDPENLVLGTVELIAKNFKKALQISREIYRLRGEEFLRYVYDELTYRIAKKCADQLIAQIIAAGTASTTTAVGVPVLTAATIGQGTVAAAMAQLSDEAANPVVIMNKQTWGAFKAVQYAGTFNADPFEGLPVVFNNSMKAYSAASTGDTYAIVGDLGNGALANFPDGEDIDFIFDEYSLKKSDLIEIMGERMVGLGVVAPESFVKINK
jgi:HK97 family phage major capsid protein